MSQIFKVLTGALLFLFIGYFYLSIETSEAQLLKNVQNLNNEIKIRKNAELLAQANMAKLNTILNSASDSIVIVNRDYRLIGLNSAAEAYVGKANDVLGKAVADVMPSPLSENYMQIYDRVFRTAKPFLVERRAILKKNEGRYFSTVFNPVVDCNGHVNEIIAITRDITDIKKSEVTLRKAKQEADSANLAKGEFLASMSHEIRTPLGVIIGYADLLSRSPLVPKELTTATNALMRNSRHLMQLIEDILDFSKVEAGRLNIHHQPMRIEEEVEKVVGLLGPTASAKGICIEAYMEGQLPGMIISDPLRIRQILLNLIGNSIKFSDSGTIRIEVHFQNSRFTRSGKVVEIKVKDEGIGISPEKQKALFKPFSQVHRHNNLRPKGTGLGLYLSKRLAQYLGGDLTLIQSNEPRGSEFVVTIDPYLEQQHEKQVIARIQQQEATTDTSTQLKNVHVLLVEDNPDTQFLMCAILQHYGATIDTADNGEDAVAKALMLKPDIVLMDIQLPVYDGITAVKKLRTQGFGRPIVALTANALMSERTRCLDAGCNDYLTKPVNQPLLVQTILEQIGQKSA